ncbi:PROTEIN putative EXPRESSED-RELATED [Salix koriyanagi]|nr:PROTEIN putative EXPRESSED-RELATED [Salix koriyanagi]
MVCCFHFIGTHFHLKYKETSCPELAMAEENQQIKSPQEPPSDQAVPTLPRMHGLGSNPVPKTTWPELVGLTAEEGERKIKKEKPGAQIEVVQPDCCVTCDFRQNRVRLHVDSLGTIQRAPRIG